ncbi:MAG: ribonuclease E/G, partial [Luteimonas sp.]|nr:ribonuclease E/G [Luteimonas sp.]
LREIEQRHEAPIVIVADEQLHTPHYEVTRLRENELSEESSKPSYRRGTPRKAATIALTKANLNVPPPAAVTNVRPSQPAPLREPRPEPAPEQAAARQAPAPMQATASTGGFVGWLKSLFGSDAPARPAPTGHDRSQGERGNRGERSERGGQRRDGRGGKQGQGRDRDRPRRDEPRTDGQRQQPTQDGQAKAARQNKPASTRQKQPKQNQPKQQGQSSKARADEQRSDAAQEAIAEKIEKTTAVAEPVQAIVAGAAVATVATPAVESGTRTAPDTDAASAPQSDAANTPDPESNDAKTEDGDGTGRRRRGRRGGRRRRRGNGEAAVAMPLDDDQSAIDDGASAADRSQPEFDFDDDVKTTPHSSVQPETVPAASDMVAAAAVREDAPTPAPEAREPVAAIAQVTPETSLPKPEEAASQADAIRVDATPPAAPFIAHESEPQAQPAPQILHGNADLAEPIAAPAQAVEVETIAAGDASVSQPAHVVVAAEIVPPPATIPEPAPVAATAPMAAPITQAPAPMATSNDHRAPGLVDSEVAPQPMQRATSDSAVAAS